MTDAPAQSTGPADRAVGLRARIPNLLTSGRLLLAAIFVLILSLPSIRPGATAPLLLAAALFIVAALTDALDGHLARRWNAISRFGRVMDPLADKVLVLAAFMLLAGPAFTIQTPEGRLLASGVAPWAPVVLLARELLITSLRGMLEGQGHDFSASLTGKLKMIAQSVAAPIILITLAFDAHGRWASQLTALTWGVVTLTALSAVPYVLAARRLAGPRGTAQSGENQTR